MLKQTKGKSKTSNKDAYMTCASKIEKRKQGK